MYTTSKEEELFDIFLNNQLEVNPEESLYIDDRRHIIEKAKEYNFKLLLMDRNNKYQDYNIPIIKDMNDIMKLLEK